jgi:hypothetical protein
VSSLLAVRLRALAGELCGGRLCFCLEGGYDVEALGEAVAETWRGLLGRPAATAGGAGGAPRAETLELIAELRRLHALDSWGSCICIQRMRDACHL